MELTAFPQQGRGNGVGNVNTRDDPPENTAPCSGRGQGAKKVSGCQVSHRPFAVEWRPQLCWRHQSSARKARRMLGAPEGWRGLTRVFDSGAIRNSINHSTREHANKLPNARATRARKVTVTSANCLLADFAICPDTVDVTEAATWSIGYRSPL